MTFKELLEKCENGTATAEEWAEVEREREKYETLTEYFLTEPKISTEEIPFGQTEQKELQKIRKSMNRRGAGIAALAAVLTCILAVAVLFFEKDISKVLWYDPTENTLVPYGYDIDGHIGVMTELLMPTVQMEQVWIDENGFGEYDLSVRRQNLIQGKTDYVYGTVKRNKIKLQSDFYQMVPVNLFTRGGDGFREEPDNGIVQGKESARKTLENLPAFIRTEAYVSLKRDWNMEELSDFAKSARTKSGWVGWTAVRTAKEGEQFFPLMGFHPMSGGIIFDELDKKYPCYEISMHKEEPQAEVWAKHFRVLLQYMQEKDDFYRRIEGMLEKEKLKRAEDYVAQHGVNTYGFLYYGTPQDLLKVLENPDVEGIYINDVAISLP